MPKPLSVLLLEDQPVDAELIIYELRKAGFELTWKCVDSELDFLANLDPEPDIILSDFYMPSWNAFAALKIIREHGLDIPFLVVSGTVGEEVAVECMRQGANDYLLKDRLGRLGQAVNSALEHKRLRLERAAAVAALRHLKDFHQNIVETIAEGIIIISQAMTITYVNPAACAIVGYGAEALVGIDVNHLDFLIPADQQSTFNRQLGGASGETMRYEFDIVRKDGTRRSLLINARMQFDEGVPADLLVAFSDITDRNKAEAELRKLYSAVEQSSSSIVLTDLQGNIEYVNPKFTQITGYSAEEVIGKNPRILQSGETPRQVYQAMWDSIVPGGEWHGELHNKKKNGELFWEFASISTVKDANGRVTDYLAVKDDITERRRMEVALAQERTLMRTLIDSLPDSIYAKDTAGRFTLKNEADARQMGAKSAQEVIGKTDFDYYPRELAEQYSADDQIVIRSGQPLLNREEPKIVGQGDHRWLLTSKIPLRDNQGKVIGLVGIGRDITERKIAEEKLRLLNRTLAVLSDVNQAIVRTRLISELFDKICHIAVEQGDFRMAWVGLLDAEAGDVTPVAHAGAVGDYLEKLAIILKDQPRGHGPTGNAVRTGKRVVVNDTERDPRVAPWREDAIRLGFRSSAAFPLKVAGKVKGTLNLYADTEAFFDDAELKLLDEMAGDISFAMEFAEHEAQRQQAETALKMHMQAVEEMGLFLQTTFDSFPANAVVLAADGTILNVNAPWIHFGDDNGATAAMHFVGTNYLGVCDRAAGPNSAEAKPAAAGIRSVIAGSAAEFNLDYPCYSETEARWFAMRVTAFPEPAPRRIVVAHVNITDRKLAEDSLKNEHALLEERVIARTTELQTTKERVEAILNNSADAIVLVHRDFRIQQTSASFNSMFHCAEDDYFGQMLDTLVVSNDREDMNRIFQAAAEERKLTVDVEAQRKDGKVFAAELSIGFISDDSFVCTFHDISERKQVEQSLRAAVETEKEMNELKSRFVSMASHEFRTPLATILAATETLTAYYDRMERSQIDARFDKIRQQIRHMTDIMENMLQLNRIQSGRVDFKPEPGQLDLLCDEIVDEFASHPLHKGRLLYSCPERPVLANFDSRLMRQIITNLVSNALKYSPKESLVCIELTRDDNGAMLKITDKGIGIPADDLKRLFEPFHRASNVGTISGTGLGLIITKEAVELHGGTITIDSKVDYGTQFTVTLPNRP